MSSLRAQALLAAQREAQLTVYRHPERIPALADDREPVKLNEAVKGNASDPDDGSTAKTRL